MLKNGCYAFLLFNHINLRNRTETVNRCIAMKPVCLFIIYTLQMLPTSFPGLVTFTLGPHSQGLLLLRWDSRQSCAEVRSPGTRLRYYFF